MSTSTLCSCLIDWPRSARGQLELLWVRETQSSLIFQHDPGRGSLLRNQPFPRVFNVVSSWCLLQEETPCWCLGCSQKPCILNRFVKEESINDYLIWPFLIMKLCSLAFGVVSTVSSYLLLLCDWLKRRVRLKYLCIGFEYQERSMWWGRKPAVIY